VITPLLTASQQVGNELEAAAYYTLPPVQMPDDDDGDEDDDDDGDEDENDDGLSLPHEQAPSHGKDREQAQLPYDDEDYRSYRSRAPNYLDPAFMPS
jgi:hypothetical protein